MVQYSQMSASSGNLSECCICHLMSASTFVKLMIPELVLLVMSWLFITVDFMNSPLWRHCGRKRHSSANSASLPSKLTFQKFHTPPNGEIISDEGKTVALHIFLVQGAIVDLYASALVSDQSMKPNWQIPGEGSAKRYVVFDVNHSFYLARTFNLHMDVDQFFKWKGPTSQLRWFRATR